MVTARRVGGGLTCGTELRSSWVPFRWFVGYLSSAGVELRYLYVGTSDTEVDVATWLHVPGATMLWRFRHFGADVAAISLGSPPTLLLADHRPSGSVLPIYAVEDLHTAVRTMSTRGWTVDLASVETPEGPAALVHSASGTELALLQVNRPNAMEHAFAAEDNIHAVRSSG
jgi:hypothetical protein